MANKYQFEKVLIVGSGQLAYKCAQIAAKYIENTEVSELKVTESTVLEKMCRKDLISYSCVDKCGLREKLLQEKDRTLVVSAGNTFLFPKEVIARDNLTIVNWHNALLPRHKGRNAEAWTIYTGDERTGVTWHLVEAGVDAGNIIIQREIPLDGKITALSLYQKQCVLGEELFAEIIRPLLSKEYKATPQAKEDAAEMHYSYEVPNGGVLDLNWSMQKISEFLRAMDYGSLLLLGKMHVNVEDVKYSFYRYKIKQAEEPVSGPRTMEFGDNNLTICENEIKIILRDLQEEKE